MSYLLILLFKLALNNVQCLGNNGMEGGFQRIRSIGLEDIDPDENLKGSPVFDSYYKLTDLEPYPEVCYHYSSEICATSWLHGVTRIAIKNQNRVGNVDFKYHTDINQKTNDLNKKFHISLSKIQLQFKTKVNKFKWKLYKSAETRRIFMTMTASMETKNQTILQKLIKIENKISKIYVKARPCFRGCLQAGQSGIENLFLRERDYDTLAGFWRSWGKETGAKIRNLFIERMNLENIGARENGYSDAASSSLLIDFEENNFSDVILNLFHHILPLYEDLHAYVRHCLANYYPRRLKKDGPIPAHLFGDVWALQWINILPIIKKCMGGSNFKDFRKEANQKLSTFTPKKMFKLSEEFYESIGMYKMTSEFWERSMLSKPTDKIADCSGSAHDFANGKDFRIKMCTKKNLNDFITIHHEMGHIQYFMAYRYLPLIFRGSANSGIHEAIGDTIALAVKTPEHLYKIGIIASNPASDNFDISYLMATALEKVVFLPYALTMNVFLWGVYNGSVPISQLNKHWWDLSYKYQGLTPPVRRSENDFDPFAKYHMTLGISYVRDFINFIIQFQFYESMCVISGHKGPLHKCDFYQSKKAGSTLLKMLKQGTSQHWRKTISILTGQKDIRAESLMKYFEPLHNWLRNENKRRKIHVGW